MSELLEQVLFANIYLQPLQFVLAIVANTLNIRVLCSHALRSSPCTYYFLTYAVLSIVYTCLVCPTQFLRGFSIDWSDGKIGCKIHFYILFVIPFQANLMLILASFDRYFSSSKSRQLHLRSSLRTAKLSVLIGSILSAIYMSPMLIIYYWDQTSKKCILKSNALILVYISSQVLLYYILIPLIMFILGLLTIDNIRQQSNRAISLTVSMRGRRTEGQLARMLVLQLSVHLILVLPFGIIYTMNSLVPSTRTPMIRAMRFVFVIWQQCDYFVSFFLYVLSGNIYRQELIRIFKSSRHHNTPRRSFVQNTKVIYRTLPLMTTTG